MDIIKVTNEAITLDDEERKTLIDIFSIAEAWILRNYDHKGDKLLTFIEYLKDKM